MPDLIIATIVTVAAVAVAAAVDIYIQRWAHKRAMNNGGKR